MDTTRFRTVRFFATISFVAMVLINALANIMPINGVGTGEVSDSYPDLFAPAGITFSIWGLIYLLLLGYILYQWGVLGNRPQKDALWKQVGVYFSISSFANVLWIFAWHYQRIGLSLLLIIIILICLIRIVESLQHEGFGARLPFSVYFGWITVATIANATTFLVSIGWDGFGIAESVWTAIVLVVGVAIGLATAMRNRDFAYGLVIVWAYAGILTKHTSEAGFANEYPLVIVTAIACIALLFLGELRILQLHLRS